MTEGPRTEAGQRLYDDLAFAAPELWRMHIERRLDETRDAAFDAVVRRLEQSDHDYMLHDNDISDADQWTEDMMTVYSATVAGLLAAIEEVRRDR